MSRAVGISFKHNAVGGLIAVAIALIPSSALAQPAIAGISVQPPQLVLPPAGSGLTVINDYGNLSSLSDEHSTIFPPGTLPGHEHEYLFFVPPGLSVLTGGAGPDGNGVWTLDFASGFVPQPPAQPVTAGPVFIAPFARSRCPGIDGQHPQDTTFDLNYAATGSVILDPTRNRSTRVLLVYEGTTLCLNVNGGATQNGASGFYASLGVATSDEFGTLWPVYRNNFTPLPGQSTTWGPDAPADGAFGSLVCVSNNCDRPPSPTFGRYPVVSPPYSIADVVASGQPLTGGMGEQAPAAFVDDVHEVRAETYVYVVHNYGCPSGILACATTASANGTITVARAQLSGDRPLAFEKWINGNFSAPGTGIGGEESSIFPASATASPAAHATCQDPSQNQLMGSISYVAETNQYLLIFLCASGRDPANPSVPPPPPSQDSPYQQRGAAWFYSTLDANQYDLSHQDHWSAPAEIAGSWHWFDSNGNYSNGRNPYCIYDGWYPSFMSLGSPSGHLSTTGYAFSMDGCTDQGAGRSRYYRSRAFTISLTE